LLKKYLEKLFMASQEYGCSGAKWEKGEYDSLEFCF
jgi:hypothetical protein